MTFRRGAVRVSLASLGFFLLLGAAGWRGSVPAEVPDTAAAAQHEASSSTVTLPYRAGVPGPKLHAFGPRSRGPALPVGPPLAFSLAIALAAAAAVHVGLARGRRTELVRSARVRGPPSLQLA